ncbi:MAG: apolipoprotein N-acyltransferase, partial [Vicingaceae bacterium]|nr:apolipoprotein N-acyltransferase [Vicingaceae bacterium]
IAVSGSILIPIVYSLIVYTNYVEEKNPVEVVVVQPNIDPYHKFGRITEAEQVNTIINLAKQKVTLNTQYIVAPETAIPRGSEESEFEKNYGVIEIRKLINEFPNLKFLTGISSQIEYGIQKNKPTLTARSYGNPKKWYDSFNTAILVDKTDQIQTYHKSKLVLGVEKMPYPKLLAPLEKLALNLGGTFGSLGAEKEAKIFKSGSIAIAPVICYESVFAGYCSSYIKKGANLIFIITNDGWWEDTPGYKQHLAFARLRAIENRRSVARSANTGTSCFINQRGDITKATNWWEEDAISSTLNSNNKMTFYSESGDWLGRILAGLSVLLLLWNWSVKLKEKYS